MKPRDRRTVPAAATVAANGGRVGPERHEQVLQRLAGNRAVAGLLTGAQGLLAGPQSRLGGPQELVTLQRQGGAPPAGVVRTAEQIAQLVADILTVIEQMEVGAGGPVTESSYDTSSGTRASYASRMQATIPWTIDLLRRHKELRTKFAITTDELNSAQACIEAVSAVWKAVLALPAGSTLEQAQRDGTVAARLGASGLAEADLQRMLAFGNWRAQVIAGLPGRAVRIAALKELGAEDLAAQATAGELATALKPANRRALSEWRKAKKKGRPPAATVADLTAPERSKLERVIGTRQVVDPLRQAGVEAGAGIGAGSAKRYLAQEQAHQDNSRVSAHWGEDLAGWRRYAVEQSLPEIGEKLKQAAVDDEGMTLGHASIGDAVAAIPKAHRTWTDEQVAWEAFRRQNGAADYADRALKIFKSTHTTPADPVPTTP